jgi:hypothetical protein
MVQVIESGVYFINRKYIIEDRGQTPGEIKNQLNCAGAENINNEN